MHKRRRFAEYKRFAWAPPPREKHAEAATEECALVGAGYNYFGQLGLGDTTPRVVFAEVTALRGKRVVAIAAGDHHCGAVTERGELYLWGRGDCGQLGDASDRNQSTPTMLLGVRVVHPDVTLRRRASPRN